MRTTWLLVITVISVTLASELLQSQDTENQHTRQERSAPILRIPSDAEHIPEENRCLQNAPERPNNGHIAFQISSETQELYASCLNGFEWETNPRYTVFTCNNNDGVWSPEYTLPNCIPICSPPCQNGGICSAPGSCQCLFGFSGSLCQDSSQGAEPSCEVLSSPLNGEISCVQDNFGLVCEAVCNDNYHFENGGSTLVYTCNNADHRWAPNENIPDCTSDFGSEVCRYLDPASNSFTSCQRGSTETSCTATCSHGYQMSNGETSVTYDCNHLSNQWIPSEEFPRCDPVCDPPCQNDGLCQTPGRCLCLHGYTGNTCEISPEDYCENNLCQHGSTCYSNPSTHSYYCSCADGFNGFYCEHVVCAERSPDNGALACTLNNTMKSCSFQCLPGYQLSQPITNSYQCHLITGLWTPELPEVYCIPEVVPTQAVIIPAMYPTLGPVGPANPDPQQGGFCFTWGQSHYRTFDGSIYNFRGGCTYLLAGNCLDNSFKIQVHNDNQCLDAGHCKRSLTLFVGNIEFSLDSTLNGVLVSRNQQPLNIPNNINGLDFSKVADYIIVRSGLGFTLRWDGAEAISVKVSESLFDETCGLCGKYNEDVIDDFTDISSTVVRSVFDFANSYKMNEISEDVCSDSSQQSLCHHSTNDDIEIAQIADRLCNQLLDFSACHHAVNPAPFYAACKEDVCGCHGNSSCQCSSYAAYAKECARHGINIVWRYEERCPITCSGGMVYEQCGSACPKTCQKTAYQCEDDHCIDGCHCPNATVKYNNVCIAEDECPCVNSGKEYTTGSEIPHDDGCNVCTCQSGNWRCTEEQCGATCSAYGDPHYVTFDGRHYRFTGKCSYVLMKTMDDTFGNFTINVDNVQCGDSRSACTKSVMITVDDTHLKLKRRQGIVVNGNDVDRSSLPIKIPGLFVEQVTDLYQRITLDNGIQVKWDSVARVYVTVPAKFFNNTCGLCGTFDRNQENDFWTEEGDIERQPREFGNKWSLDRSCASPQTPPSDPCEIYTQRRQQAEQLCGMLRQSPFTECNNLVNVDGVYTDCMFDQCNQGGDETPSEVLCDYLSSYAMDCANHGLVLAWRDVVPQCFIECEREKVYQECGSACQTSCAALGYDCQQECIPGCSCPPGMVEDYHGNCVLIEECPCKYNNKMYASGELTHQDCKTCQCTSGVWQCEDRECEDTELECSENMEFSMCKNNCPLTCTNMNHGRSCASSTCEPGCQCLEGYVLDDEQCILPQDCPCHHGGTSYQTGNTILMDCNTCTCNGQHWECTSSDCPEVCTTWGDSHHETFDGKLYRFQGHCTYTLSQSTANNPHIQYSVTTENIPCGTSGVTCTKSVIFTVGSGNDRQRIELVRDNPVVFPKDSVFQVWETGRFVFIRIQEGVTVQWDRGTRVYVKLDPKHRGMVEGLCGNFNSNQMDDFRSPAGGPSITSSLEFGDSWKVFESCPNSVHVNDTCSLAPHRKAWADKKCSILKGPLFQPCHSEVPYEPYYETCVYDACGCDTGGDCECLCTAIATYAEKCNMIGISTRWRSQYFCPMQCEGCGHYEACTSACPKTCDNYYQYDTVMDQCDQTCVEGCQCPDDEVYDVESNRCISPSECYCLKIDGVKYFEGQTIQSLSDDCQTCFCSNHSLHCLGQPCGFTPATTAYPTLSTVFTTILPATTMATTPSITERTTLQPTTEATTPSITERTTLQPTTEATTTSITERTTLQPTTEATTPSITERTTLQPTTSPSPTTSVTSPIPVSSAMPCDSWTPWLNSDMPFLGSIGDMETLQNLRSKYTFCERPNMIKCRTVNQHYAPNEQDIGVTCQLHHGLSCVNANQTSGLCYDYEVSFFCPCEEETTVTSPTVSTSFVKTTPVTFHTVPPTLCTPGMTPWMNIDSPMDGDGDMEPLDELRQFYGFCRFPEAIECRDAQTDELYTKTGETLTCDLMNGLLCFNSDQINGLCRDYKVRLDCGNCGVTSPPNVTESTSVTESTTISRTTMSTTTGIETSSLSPITTEAVTTTTTVSPTTQILTTLGTLKPECIQHGWSLYMSSDVGGYLMEDGDFETFENLRKYYVFCERPVDIKCRLVKDKEIYYNNTGQRGVTCDVNHGLVCLNRLQVRPSRYCYDYEVSVYCICETPPPSTLQPVVTTTETISTTVTVTETVTTTRTTEVPPTTSIVPETTFQTISPTELFTVTLPEATSEMAEDNRENVTSLNNTIHYHSIFTSL
ncbi:mucin-2-like [Saccoglossus kowalevskii]